MTTVALHRVAGSGANRFTSQSAAHISGIAVAALIAELETWPKPGLVSHVDSGSHTDMTASTFRASTSAIEPFLTELAEAGAAGAPMGRLRTIGIAAEHAMLSATRGVNTHRGAIFGLGLLCAAAGAAWTDTSGLARRWPPGLLCELVRVRWGQSILRGPIPLHSHGANALRQHGAGGARAQAATGFPHAWEFGLPALRLGRALAPGNEEAARVQAFFALLAATEDTNLLHRGGTAGLAYAQAAAAGFLASGGIAQPDWQDAAGRIHRAFIDRRLSPGGCADLLAITLFLDGLEEHP